MSRKISIKCQQCGDWKTVYLSHRDTMFCSKKCKNIAAMKKDIDGKRLCSDCGLWKDLSCFSGLLNRREYVCRPCRNQRQTQRRRTPTGRYYCAKTSAEKRGLIWDISFTWFTRLCQKSCTYCGESTGEVGSGLDRINNDEGYHLKNVVPCCGKCNRLRSNIFSHQEMLLFVVPMIRKVKQHRKATTWNQKEAT